MPEFRKQPRSWFLLRFRFRKVPTTARPWLNFSKWVTSGNPTKDKGGRRDKCFSCFRVHLPTTTGKSWCVSNANLAITVEYTQHATSLSQSGYNNSKKEGHAPLHNVFQQSVTHSPCSEHSVCVETTKNCDEQLSHPVPSLSALHQLFNYLVLTFIWRLISLLIIFSADDLEPHRRDW